MDALPDGYDFEGPALDLGVIESLRELGGDGDRGLVMELIEMFLDDAPDRLAEMIEGIDGGDAELMIRSAHSLKTAAANLGAMLLSQICREMEIAARGGDARAYRLLTRPCREAYDLSARALREIT